MTTLSAGDLTDPEDREQQADITRRLLYFLNAPIVEHCRLRGVLPAPGAVRIAIRAGDDENARDFLYEIPNDAVTPYYVPGLLRTVLTGPQLHSSSDVDEVMGMALIRLRPQEITPDPEPEQGRALTAVRALSGPGDDEDPFLIGFLMHGDGLLRLYLQRTDRPGIVGADIRLTEMPATALIASLPSLVEEDQYRQPSPDDPHCDLLVDLTNW
ncbi:hypothetical protein ACFV2Z_09030 [Streptomyces sp. NPDC059688]|uniref:hypothetical protein n=1 Tax=Streptomyces sp. NPDC059688 TaxID=3346906 RepID=UPI0036BE15BD